MRHDLFSYGDYPSAGHAFMLWAAVGWVVTAALALSVAALVALLYLDRFVGVLMREWENRRFTRRRRAASKDEVTHG